MGDADHEGREKSGAIIILITRTKMSLIKLI